MQKPEIEIGEILKTFRFDTLLGQMVTIGGKERIYLLEFADRPRLEQKIEKFYSNTKTNIVHGSTEAINNIRMEIESYFNGVLKEFKTPICLLGTSFQKLVWEKLSHIKYGQTSTYKAQAEIIGKAFACRAVANANASNSIAIVVPCHRVINSNGNIGGYAGGKTRKQWLLEHEKMYKVE